MTGLSRAAAAALAGLGCLAFSAAPIASAAPECTEVGATVTFCETNGSTQLTATPPPWNFGGWTGIGYWPLIGAYGVGDW